MESSLGNLIFLFLSLSWMFFGDWRGFGFFWDNDDVCGAGDWKELAQKSEISYRTKDRHA